MDTAWMWIGFNLLVLILLALDLGVLHRKGREIGVREALLLSFGYVVLAHFKATLKHVPGAAGKIVHDRFHIMKHVGEAVDRVRKHERRELLAQEDHRLKGTKYLWLYREENVPDKHRPALETLKAANLKVAKAWAMKESLNDVWNTLVLAGLGVSLRGGWCG